MPEPLLVEETEPLGVEHFGAFVAEVHTVPGSENRREPFPWQSALLRRVVEHGWPSVVDVPTGLGKTSVLDVAVFAAALGARDARRRIFFVVDRRIVVDEAYEHATAIADALANPRGPVTSKVAAALRVPGDERVLDVTRMRGGVTWDWLWVERPDRYAIVTGTVDQVGSRLLFRGYGVGENLRSVDAALVGTDSLIIVDEAHLVEAFRRTLTDALAADHSEDLASLPRPLVVAMSATSGQADGVHGITADDEQHEIAGRRLRAPKRWHLVEVPTSKRKAAEDVPAALAAIASQFAPSGVVGVVVNTVARARAVFNLVRGRGLPAVLLTGRSRPVDRDYLLARYYDRIRAGRSRNGAESLIVVATQTVEVGANVDFDALVSESAPLSSLVQRIGRLNRLGEAPEAPAIVVHDTSVDEKDPVYGPARLATWKYLVARMPAERYSSRWRLGPDLLGADASPLELRAMVRTLPPEVDEATRPPKVYVPVLWPETLDSWARTSPTPQPDQPVEPYLHGIDGQRRPVTLVWRSGLDRVDPQEWGRIVDAMPPRAEESLEVDVSAVRRWLTGTGADPHTSDLDAPASPDADEEEAVSGRQVLRYVKRGESVVITPDQIKPGDVIVVPTTYGGCDEYGWDPASDKEVVDMADVAREPRPGAALLLRVGPTLRRLVETHHNTDSVLRAVERLEGLAADRDDADQSVAYHEALRELADALHSDSPSHAGTPLATLVTSMAAAPAEQLVVIRSAPDDTAPGGVDLGYDVLLRTGSPVTDDDTDAGSSAARTPLALDQHEEAVAARAREFAANIGLPDAVVASVEQAGRWHDEGKRDIRFQAMLHGGDMLRAELARYPLAKSGMDPADRVAFQRAQRLSGYPRGMRHEALSARIAAVRVAGRTDLDPELVVHLVASHHGRARPLLPAVVDPAPVKVELETGEVFDSDEVVDWHGPRRFTTLNRRYGRWGLALLEAIVRMADIWCSMRGEGAER